MGTVSTATINVRGLRDNLKRKQVLSFLKNSKHHIICLQETHEYAVDNKKWEKEWDGKSVWCSAPQNSYNGVAILFKKFLNVEVVDSDEDQEGRIFRVTIRIDGLEFQIVTIYGPNPSTVLESEEFFASLTTGGFL